jgi:hypothetical protein
MAVEHDVEDIGLDPLLHGPLCLTGHLLPGRETHDVRDALADGLDGVRTKFRGFESLATGGTTLLYLGMRKVRVMTDWSCIYMFIPRSGG